MRICVGEGAREAVWVEGGDLGKNQVRSEAVGVEPTVRIVHGGSVGEESLGGDDQWDEDGMREGVKSSVEEEELVWTMADRVEYVAPERGTWLVQRRAG